MNAVEIYRNIDTMRDIIWIFDINLNRIEEKNTLKSSVAVLEQLVCYAMKEPVFDISEEERDDWSARLEMFRYAVESEDELFLYDFFHSDLEELLCRMFRILWKRYSKELRDYFWRENAQALKQRYPEILKRIGESDRECDFLGIREYGLRGNVLFFREDKYEHDLYSEYNPNDFSFEIVRKYHFNRYKKIFIWTLGGDFDVGVIFRMCEMGQTKLEVYVSSMETFGKFLCCTFRKGMLLEPRINYNFNCTMEDFLEDAKVENDVFIYIDAYCLQDCEKKEIRNLLRDKQIDNNVVEDGHEKYFTGEQGIEKVGQAI